MPKKKTTPRGRDSGTGRFIPVKDAERRKKTATVDRIPIGKPKRKK